MYILVNNDLKISKGKIAYQVGHVVQQIIEAILVDHFTKKLHQQSHEFQNYCDWSRGGCSKIFE